MRLFALAAPVAGAVHRELLDALLADIRACELARVPLPPCGAPALLELQDEPGRRLVEARPDDPSRAGMAAPPEVDQLLDAQPWAASAGA